MLWPDGIVAGSEIPPMLNCALFVLAAVIVTSVPEALTFPDAIPLVPTTTLPTARGVGVTLSCPAVVVPVPDSGIVNLELDAFEAIMRLPFALPAAVGANVTLKDVLCPAASVSGVVGALKLNAAPVSPS
jgi:hypothetical protein